MRVIQSIVDVCKYCNPDSAKIVSSKTEVFETTHSKTAIVYKQLGVLYFVACVTPGTTSIERLIEPTESVTMRAVPKLIKERLEFLDGERAFSDPLAKRVLYLALAATPELELLNELEGHEHVKTEEIMPWGLTRDAQEKIATVYMNVRSRENAARGGKTKPLSDEQPSKSSRGSHDGRAGKRKRIGR